MQYLSNVFSKKHRDKELSSLKNLDSIPPEMAIFSIVEIRNILVLTTLYKEYKNETDFCLIKDNNFKILFSNCIFPLVVLILCFACTLFLLSEKILVSNVIFYGILIFFSCLISGLIFLTCSFFYTIVTSIIIKEYNHSDSNKEIIINSIRKMQNIKYTEEKDKIMKVVSLKKKSEPVSRKRL